LKVNDENSWIRIRIRNLLFSGMDPRIRIHTKMLWIRITGVKIKQISWPSTFSPTIPLSGQT
jgi:hypothetical protein